MSFVLRIAVPARRVLSEVSNGGHARIGATVDARALLVVLEPVDREVIPDGTGITLATRSDHKRDELGKQGTGTIDGQHRHVLAGPEGVLVGKRRYNRHRADGPA
jgi:hypothetical protein